MYSPCFCNLCITERKLLIFTCWTDAPESQIPCYSFLLQTSSSNPGNCQWQNSNQTFFCEPTSHQDLFLRLKFHSFSYFYFSWSSSISVCCRFSNPTRYFNFRFCYFLFHFCDNFSFNFDCFRSKFFEVIF